MKTVNKCTREKDITFKEVVLSIFYNITIFGNEMLFPHRYALNN